MTQDIRLDQRLTRVEMAISEQQQEIDALNKVVTEQWKALDLHKAQINKMIEKIGELEQGSGPAAHQKPPHY